MINSQKRILIARLLLPLLVFCSVFFPMRQAQAILPAVILADAIVEHLIIRSVAREVVATVSTAANDASWVSTFTNFLNSARSIGSLVISASNNKTYEILTEADSVGDLTHADTVMGFKYFYPIVAVYSATNFQIASPTFSNASADVVASQYVVWWNSQAKAQYKITSVDTCYVDGYNSYCGAYAGQDYLFDIQLVGVDIEIADGIKRIIGGVNGWSADPTDPDWTASEILTLKNFPTFLLGWHVPAHASTCPQPQLDLSGYLGEGKVYIMNSHCQLVQNNAAILQASMMLVYSIMALFIVLRA